ncbi:MAG TPA: TRAP transporter small permease [Hydrogenophaga sp.]|uniref:TRAP transporter small permease n=1 Tax=Hydrogenophaga sp. TaxID=1904254 RepID=UPI0008CE2B2A|nr:TRAP transporter small permease [Hydrogenophaga sp.]OGA75523.1 MAG: C4-dicarboxylate ABC transporter permease [Burkholderiales bacterium GWE1_65_30]OGA93649.1 MAG: C4-dicarboxylate ABC transporter permease [Burkholderiales bacterium GWF1_66_17]HAX20251.1 TRAP transporter small permease [Hydrogenophaga sp.]HBU18587.1 TRAP transporter small permease [Hydrogenophaga sp.]
MKSLFLSLDRALTGLSLALACALLVVISCLGIWQVAARFIFEQPSSWTEEFMRRLLIWMVALGVVVAFRQGSLVSVDLMLRVSKGRWRTVIRSIISATSLAFLSVLAWQGFILVERTRFQTFASIDISMAWAYAALPVAAVLAIVAVIAHHLDPHNDELATAQ